MDDFIRTYQPGDENALATDHKSRDHHVNEFEELIVGVEGETEHFIDFKAGVYKAPFVSFITQGKVHKVKPLPVEGKYCI
ncbi:MAG: hypothetical protein WCQ70_03815 [Lentimicrobiaceae bacterium]